MLFEIDVAHIDAHSGRMRILLVLQDYGVAVESFLTESVDLVSDGEGVEEVECEVDVDEVEGACLLTHTPYFPLFPYCFFCLLQCLLQPIIYF